MFKNKPKIGVYVRVSQDTFDQIKKSGMRYESLFRKALKNDVQAILSPENTQKIEKLQRANSILQAILLKQEDRLRTLEAKK